MKYIMFYFKDIIPYLLIAAFVIFCVRLYKFKRYNNNSVKTEILFFLFYLYLVAVFLNTVVPSEILRLNFTSDCFMLPNRDSVYNNPAQSYIYIRSFVIEGLWFRLFHVFILNLILLVPFGIRQEPFQILSRVGCLDFCQLLRRARAHDGAAPVAPFRPQVDQVVRRLDDVEIVLDDDDGIAAIDKALEDAEELVDVGRVQARRRFVEDVERAARRAARELRRELDALRLAARERRRWLAELDIAEADILDDLELARDARYVLEERDGLVNRHVEHIGDVLALVLDFERLAVIARAFADLAGHVDVRQEMHFNLQDTVALACFAAAALDVEAEAAGFVAAHLRLARLAEQLADGVEDARIRRRIRARRAADGLLVDVDDLVDVFEALDFLVLARLALRMIEARGDALVENFVDERRLARARNARDERQRAERESDIDVLEVVLGRADDLEELAVSRTAARRDRDEFAP